MGGERQPGFVPRIASDVLKSICEAVLYSHRHELPLPKREDFRGCRPWSPAAGMLIPQARFHGAATRIAKPISM